MCTFLPQGFLFCFCRFCSSWGTRPEFQERLEGRKRLLMVSWLCIVTDCWRNRSCASESYITQGLLVMKWHLTKSYERWCSYGTELCKFHTKSVNQFQVWNQSFKNLVSFFLGGGRWEFIHMTFIFYHFQPMFKFNGHLWVLRYPLWISVYILTVCVF